MRNLLMAVVLAVLTVGASASQVSSAPVVQVAPLSEVVILECDKFKGAIIVLPDGTLRPTTDVAAARAVFESLPDQHAAVVRTGQFCGPEKQT